MPSLNLRRVWIVAACTACTACASARPQAAPDDAGLPRAGDAAVLFAPGVVSTGDVFASTFTPDGRTVVFTKVAPGAVPGGPLRMTLMQSRRVDGGWSTPEPLPFSGTWRDLDPAFTPDGARLYFSSWRPSGPSAADTTTAADTWYVDRRGDGWAAPVRLAAPVNGPAVDMYPSVTSAGVLYFDSFRSTPPRRLVYRAAPAADGTFGEPALLHPAINADSGASNLFVDPAERYVVFGAVRPGGRGGLDLYLSRRAPDGGWSTPIGLGPQVNTPDTEFCPFVSRDGRFLYFTRVSAPAGGAVTRNVYVVRFDDLRARLTGA
jgi:hypothetical protein